MGGSYQAVVLGTALRRHSILGGDGKGCGAAEDFASFKWFDDTSFLRIVRSCANENSV